MPYISRIYGNYNLISPIFTQIYIKTHENGRLTTANGIWANILYQKGGSAAIPQTN